MRDNGVFSKNFRRKLNKQRAIELAGAVGKYASALEGLGLNVAKTQVELESAGNGRYSLKMSQEPFERHQLAADILRNKPDKDALIVYEKILSQAVNAIKANSLPGSCRQNVGLDLHIGNWAVKNGEPVFLDVFPPLSSGSEAKSVEKTYPLKVKLFESLLPKHARERHYYGPTVLSTLLGISIEANPKLKAGLIKATVEQIEKEFSNDVRRLYLREISGIKLSVIRGASKLTRLMAR
ncbi:MAG: DUF6206 family protein [Candidatus Diapherotrites archaeon]